MKKEKDMRQIQEREGGRKGEERKWGNEREKGGKSEERRREGRRDKSYQFCQNLKKKKKKAYVTKSLGEIYEMKRN